MKAPGIVVAVGIYLSLGSLLCAQDFKSPPPILPAAETLKEIKSKKDRLGQMLTQLRRQGVRDPGLADVEIYLDAAARIDEHKEYFHEKSGAWTLEALDRGALRARFLSTGETPWMANTGFPLVRGYRSRIDGTVQPYAVTYPPGYGKDPNRRWRLDVVLHGRDTTLTEVKFLHQFDTAPPAGEDQGYVQLNIFGRGNNAYRWAGETDVLEAMENFIAHERIAGRERLIDAAKIVLRGFSMGGAGTWHLGLHYPDRWAVLGPGAGFSTTHGYVPKLPKTLPNPQEDCLRIYDAVLYAENAFNVPIVAYSGAKDPQMQAAVNIADRLDQLGLRSKMTHLVAADQKHAFPLDWRKKAEGLYAKHVAEPRTDFPQKVRFVTYTLKYPSCSWVEVLGLGKHYERARVDAERTPTGFTIQTSNVRALHLTLPEGPAQAQDVAIDGQKLNVRPWLNQAGSYHLYLHKKAGQWVGVLPQRLSADRARRPQKVFGLQGPIDDAFTDAFLCVRGTDKPWHEATGQYAEANLERFCKEWAKYFRGTLPIKDDIDVSNDDIAARHLVLFGDPASNSLIAQVLDALPLTWTKERIGMVGRDVSAEDHVPVLIHPNPLNPGRYVVLNSGHTFRAADLQATNAMLYPRLGDFSLLRLTSTGPNRFREEVVTSGLFDEFWQLPP